MLGVEAVTSSLVDYMLLTRIGYTIGCLAWILGGERYHGVDHRVDIPWMECYPASFVY